LSSSRDLRRALVAVTVAVGCAVTAGCGSGSSDADATPRTATLARIEAAHLCAATAHAFRSEADIDADLARRLDEHGLDRATWKRWHDTLIDAPARAAQLAAANEAGCPTP
jgi:hypothetical protein